MAAINDLIAQIQDESLRDRIQKEVDKLAKQKKFGLVFEDHIPECTPLYDIPVKRGALVALKGGNIKENYFVKSISGGVAKCVNKASGESAEFAVDDLVTIAEFGEPIYPYLKPLDSVCNAPDSDLWHTLIEADNYHALQLLEYLYAGKVDCIYIDPPYNTGAKDWKYNNDYVDGNDTYRHSKWLSMMQKRLKIAKKLLNPKDSVLIVTIDEKEYLHLGCLLEEMFPEANIQMISTVINVKGSSRIGSFARSGEYIFFVMFGAAKPQELPLDKDWLGNISSTSRDSLRLANMMRFGADGTRERVPNGFYPIFLSADGKRFVGVGEPLERGVDRSTVNAPEGAIIQWPLHLDGKEGRWGYTSEKLKKLIQKGYIHIGKPYKYGYSIVFIQEGWQKRIELGEVKITGYGEDGFVQVDCDDYVSKFTPGDMWAIKSHNASEYGSRLLINILGQRFAFPKSLYAVHDAIRFFVANKPNALIVDFFAGSGTTLHAVNLLNAEDGGHRRCIMVTNNEVSADEAKTLTVQGFKPGDEEWEKLGIARYVTWPRTVCSIEGHDVNGNPLKGNYIGSDIPMADGFKANAAFFKLGFLDKNMVALGRQLAEMMPTLWLKAGAHGICPKLDEGDDPDMLILSENKMAILIEESCFPKFEAEVLKHPEIDTVFIVTDSESGYREMITGFAGKDTYQLYRDYLDNFRINTGRN